MSQSKSPIRRPYRNLRCRDRRHRIGRTLEFHAGAIARHGGTSDQADADGAAKPVSVLNPMPGQQNPWDIPPFPTIGDMEEDTVYASVGRALSSWELFECRLSRIFSGLTGRINGTSPAMRAYGAVLTFRAAIYTFFGGRFAAALEREGQGAMFSFAAGELARLLGNE
jgi:hypothetical protein